MSIRVTSIEDARLEALEMIIDLAGAEAEAARASGNHEAAAEAEDRVARVQDELQRRVRTRTLRDKKHGRDTGPRNAPRE